MKMLLGLRQIHEGSALPQDIEALRRRTRGGGLQPRVQADVPAGWQELGLGARYEPRTSRRSGISMPAPWDCGRCANQMARSNSTSGTTRSWNSRRAARHGRQPAMQMSSLAAIIMRVGDALALRAELKSAGVHFVHDLITHPKGDLVYVSDPEGNVIGFSDRLHPGSYVESLPTELPPVSIEDVEAQRRWVESMHR